MSAIIPQGIPRSHHAEPSQIPGTDTGIASEHVWPHMLAPQTWGGLPGDPDPMVGKASGPLTRLME